jgi:outer membrane protein TolC
LGLRGGARLAVALVVALATPARATAEPLPSPLHAADIAGYAAKNRQEIVSARERARAAWQRPRATSSLADPMLVTNLDHLPVMFDGADVSFMVEQQVSLSGVLGAIDRRETQKAKAFDADVGRVELDAQTDALLAFVMLAEEQAMRRVVADQLSLADSVTKIAEARIAGGAGAPSDVVRAALERTRIEAELSVKDANIRSADAMLDAALGREPDPAVPDAELAPVDTLPDDAAIATAERDRPEISVMRRRVAAADEDVEVMRNMRAPMAVFGLGAAYTMGDGPGFMAKVGLSIPIDWGKYDAGIEESRAMASMERADLAAMRTMVAGESAAARERVVAARVRALALRTKVLPQAQQAFELSLTSYGTGQVPIVTVLESVALLRDLQMAEVTARADLARAWVRMGRATGKPAVGLGGNGGAR